METEQKASGSLPRKTWLIAIASLIAGILIGGGGVEAHLGSTATRQRAILARSKQVFDQKLTCNRLGKKYVEENTDATALNADATILLQHVYTLEQVDFSEQKNSCVAMVTSLTDTTGKPPAEIWRLQIVDLGTEEILDVDSCPEHGDCQYAHSVLDPEFKKMVDTH